MPPRYVADLSLALINRTGAYHVCRDLVVNLPNHIASVRYWRLYSHREPQGVIRRLLGAAMLLELKHSTLVAPLPSWRRASEVRRGTLFLDPLYVLHADLQARDIVLCHDVGPVSTPHLFDTTTSVLYRKAYAQIRDRRPGMVFVSEASRADFVAHFGEDFPFLAVIPLYVRAGSTEGPAERPAGVNEPFLLTVAALETRKNYPRAIDAFTRSGLRDLGYSFVFCGPRGNDAIAVQEQAGRTPGVHALGFVSDAGLRWLYRNAAGFVLPSLLEGFGLPAAEAAQHGLLSVISTGGALAEAVGGGALLVDPLDVEDIARGIHQLATMPAETKVARLAIAQGHAATLTFERYLSSWSQLLDSIS